MKQRIARKVLRNNVWRPHLGLPRPARPLVVRAAYRMLRVCYWVGWRGARAMCSVRDNLDRNSVHNVLPLLAKSLERQGRRA